MSQLNYFFNPKSVAIIGASRNPKKIGHVVFRNFFEGKFKGRLYPINPKAKDIFGQKCYRSVLDIKYRIDLGIISVPATLVPLVLEDCGKKRIPAVIIISAGFKEIGNVKLGKKVKKILKKYKMRAIGPNCLGVFDPYSNVDTFFLPRYKLGRPGKGNISFISQSGALGSVVLDWMAMRNYKISKFISYGNALDIDEAELAEYLGKDKRTNVICAYFEGVKEGRRFFEIAKKITKKKPLIVLKGGVTSEGNKATLSHTGSLAGSKEVYSAAFKQAGVIEAKDFEEIFDFARVLATQPKPKGNRVQIITDGGGFGVLTTDFVIQNNLKLAKMNKKTAEALKKQMPSYAVLENPMDLTGDADQERYRIAINAALEDPNVDMIALIILFQIPTLTADIVEVVAEANDKSKKPIIVISAGGNFTEVLKRALEEFGVPCFSYPANGAKALRALYDFGNNTRGENEKL